MTPKVPTKPMGFYRPHDRKKYQEHGAMPDGTIPPSMTKQEFQGECDINNILRHFSATGSFNHVSAKAAQGAFSDLPDSYDFQDALNTVHAGQQAFAQLPAKLRSRFGNEPQEFLEFCADPANADEMRSLGLANPLAGAPTPIAVTMVNLDDPMSPDDVAKAKKQAAKRDE